MARSNKNQPAVVAQMTLAALVAFGSNGTFAKQDAIADLIAAGHAEVNPTVTNEQGEVAVRATQAGYDAMNAPTNTESTGTAVAETKPASTGKKTFVIETNVPVPTIAGRGGRSGSIYPFADLPVGGSFFVANSDVVSGNAAKTLASTVSGQNKLYAEEIPGQTRKNRKGADVPATKQTRAFSARGVTENGVEGARVWRTL